MTPEKLSELRGIVATLLRKRFQRIEFDPIEMRHGFGHEGDEVVFVNMVYDDTGADNNGTVLDTKKMIDLHRDVRENFTRAGTEAFPIISFLRKSEWQEEPRNATG